MLLDQFKFRVPPDLRMYLEEREVTNFNQAAKLADTYFMTHRRSFTFRQNNVKGFSGSQYPAISGGGRSAAPGYYEPETLLNPDVKAVFCAYCKQGGHHITECPRSDCQKSKHYKKLEGQNKGVFSVQSSGTGESLTEDLFSYFVFSGFVMHDRGQPMCNIKILRDTGATQSVLTKDSLPNIERKFNGDYVVILTLIGYQTCPIANIYLKTDLVEGFYKVAVVDGTLPGEFKGINLLLGNDIAGRKVLPRPIVQFSPLSAEALEINDETETQTVCAVTRSQSRCNEESLNFDELPITKSNLVKAQREDPTLNKCFERVEDSIIKSTGFYIKDDVLMRRYCPKYVNVQDEWAVVTQIVVPEPFRNLIIDMTHNKYSGHLGSRRTSDKILRFLLA